MIARHAAFPPGSFAQESAWMITLKLQFDPGPPHWKLFVGTYRMISRPNRDTPCVGMFSAQSAVPGVFCHPE